MTNEETMTSEGGLTRSTADQIKDELSGGFVKANSLSELDKLSPSQPDQSADNGNEEAKSDDSIGLSKEDATSSEDASNDRGEEDGGSASTSTPADDETTEDESSPFSTEEDEVHDEIKADAEEEFIDDDEYFTTLSEQVGYEITSDEDIITLVRHLEKKDPLEEVSPFLKQVIEFENNGGDVREYFNVLSVDTSTLSDKEAMWNEFKVGNSTLAQESPEFARQKFEKDFNTKYKIVSDARTEEDFDTLEDFQAFKSEQDYSRKELEWESKKAKEKLEADREAVLASSPTKSQVNEEEIQKIYEEYKEDATYYKENFDTLQIPIDAEGKTNYNIGLNERSRPMFNEWMDNPSKFLEHIGIGSDNRVDAETLATNIALIAAFSVDGEFSVGSQFANAMTERLNKNSVETRLEHPAPEGGKSNSGGTGGESEVQEAITALRDDFARQRRR